MESKGSRFTLGGRQNQDQDPDSASRPPPLSLTLPANFTFSYSDAPKTPEPHDARSSTPLQPDPPRIRIKRRRAGFAPHELDQAAAADAIPSIELSESLPTGASSHAQTDDSMLAPRSSSSLPPSRFASPPHTPLPRAGASFFDQSGHVDWYSRHRNPDSADITRPSSAFSQFSDSSSSFSSYSSSDTFTSVTDSCITPDTERKDLLLAPQAQRPGLASPVHFRPAPPPKSKKAGKRPKRPSDVRWTPDMDEHLWLTYINYLSDPTVTPFKTLPGVPPPIGVCYRVAHAARRTWRSRRSRLSTVVEDGATPFASLDGTVMRREASAPPMLNPPGIASPQSPAPHWPKESVTRKRLRALCKHKPSLSPHYQRLMQSRSPSPFESGTRARLASPPLAPRRSPFSTRDLSINLTTSTAASMQLSGPLAQLASDPPAEPIGSPLSAAAAIAPPSRPTVHQKSASLQHDLAFGLPLPQPQPQPQPAPAEQHTLADARRLASPFHEPRRAPAPALAPASVPAAPSPPELHHPRPLLSNSMKRRAQYPLGEELLAPDPAQRREFLEDLFRDPSAAAGKRRVRARGFSLGAVRHAGRPARHISSLFAPPSPASSSPSSSAGAGALAGAFAGGPPRLGSPFSPGAGLPLSNTFPRGVLPRLADPFVVPPCDVNGGGGEGAMKTDGPA